MPYGQTMTLERPVNDASKFTAIRNGTYEAQCAELDERSPDNGLIKVVWKPGHQETSWYNAVVNYPRITWYEDNTSFDNSYDDDHAYTIGTVSCRYDCNTTTKSCSCSSNELSGGGIGLSGNSNQEFSEVSNLCYDEPETTIYLRIAFRDGIKPLKRKVYKMHSRLPKPLR